MTVELKGNSITTITIDGIDYDGKYNAPEKRTVSEADVEANGNVLYLVNCGTNRIYNVPDGYRMGEETGLKWGLEKDDDYSIVVSKSSGKRLEDECVYMSTDIKYSSKKSGFKYRFELPELNDNKYNVTVGFKNPSGWGTKSIDVKLEGKTVGKEISINDKNVTEKKYNVIVEDGELNVMVHNPRRTSSSADPTLSYIIVKAGTDETAESDPVDKPEVSDEIDPVTYDSFTGTEGAKMYDTNGHKIQAHGGAIQKFTVNGETKYYWYGEDKTHGTDPVTGGIVK